nr:MAG TPA: hypothetical protein [Caudoviricetes sp.]
METKTFKYNQWEVTLSKKQFVSGGLFVTVDILGDWCRYSGIHYGSSPDTGALYDYVAYDYPECISKGLKERIYKRCIKMLGGV